MNIGTAEALLVAVFLRHLLHDIWTSDEHLCLVAYHKDEVGECR